MNIVDSAIKAGMSPERIAFVAFTRKAADEARDRAIVRFGFEKDQLPWFRTIHSVAFKILGIQRADIMQEQDYREIGYELGFSFSDLDSITFVPAGTTLGDKVARVESLARLRCVSLQQQWEDSSLIDLNFSSVLQWEAGVQRFKQSKGMMDYTDLLEQFSTALDVDLFILDEAQDLSPLQWKVVDLAASRAEKIYLAGDDDQAIYDFSGANSSVFLEHEGESVVLPQSFRTPRSVQRIAQEVSNSIRVRQPKVWAPREAEGKVDQVRYESSLDLSEGSWLLLARNHMALSRFETVVQNQGYTYIKEDKHSTSDSAGRAIQSWEKWRKGARLDTKSIRNLNKFIPGLIGWVPRLPSTIEESPLDLAMKDRSWMDVIQIAAKKREYIRSCLANHESLFDKPRVTISTIHHAKGGEADHVALITDITQNPWNQMETDSEKRVLYVALTRAKETLTLIQPATIRHYNV